MTNSYSQKKKDGRLIMEAIKILDMTDSYSRKRIDGLLIMEAINVLDIGILKKVSKFSRKQSWTWVDLWRYLW